MHSGRVDLQYNPCAFSSVAGIVVKLHNEKENTSKLFEMAHASDTFKYLQSKRFTWPGQAPFDNASISIESY